MLIVVDLIADRDFISFNLDDESHKEIPYNEIQSIELGTTIQKKWLLLKSTVEMIQIHTRNLGQPLTIIEGNTKISFETAKEQLENLADSHDIRMTEAEDETVSV